MKRPELDPDAVLELYSIRDAARLFGLTDSRLRYWIQTGFVRPSVRQGGRFYYKFCDLVGIKAAVELLGAGVPQDAVRRALDLLRRELPAGVGPTSRLRVLSDGETLAVVEDGEVGWEADGGQLVMAFALSALAGQIAKALDLPASVHESRPERAAPAAREDAAPVLAACAEAGATERTSMASAYRLFLDGCRAEDAGDLAFAELCYRRVLELEPSLAAAHTNLGNLCYRRGDRDQARRSYQRALDLEPDQPEARYNLANLLDEEGDTELAVAELRSVCSRHPAFADAHYNLGLLLYRLGGHAQARQHLGHYLGLDPSSEWATRARDLLASSP
jgi:tetratricopeptide (TPR) repeat protein